MTKKGKGFLPSLIRKPPKFLTNIVSKVITGRKDFSPSSKNVLSEYGDCIITGMIIGRHPLFSPITWIANKITTGEPYDKLFHLYMIVNTHKGSVLIEKK